MTEKNGEAAPKTRGVKGKLTEIDARLESISQALSDLAAAERSKEKYAPVSLRKTANWLETHWSTRILLSVGGLAALIAFGWSVFVFLSEASIRAEERAARQDERAFRERTLLAMSWDTLTTRASGNIGKGPALSHVVSSSGLDAVSYLDISCEAVGAHRDDNCLNPTPLQNVQITDEWCQSGFGGCYYSHGVAFEMNFEETRLSGIIEGADLQGARIGGAKWLNTRLNRVSLLEPNFSKGPFSCRYCKFVDVESDISLLENLRGSFIVNGTFFVNRSSNPSTELSSIDEVTGRYWTLEGPAEPMIFAHYPPVFLRDAPGESSEYQGFYRANTKIAWDAYRDFEYCVPDFDGGLDTDLVSIWMCDELNGSPLPELNAGRSGGSGPPEPYQSDWFPKGTDYVESVREDFRFADGSNFALLRRNSFVCGVPYETVEEIIRVSISKRALDHSCEAE